MTLREDIANLRKLVERFYPRPERTSGLRLLDFYDEAIAALRWYGRLDNPDLSETTRAREVLAKLDEEVGDE